MGQHRKCSVWVNLRVIYPKRVHGFFPRVLDALTSGSIFELGCWNNSLAAFHGICRVGMLFGGGVGPGHSLALSAGWAVRIRANNFRITICIPFLLLLFFEPVIDAASILFALPFDACWIYESDLIWKFEGAMNGPRWMLIHDNGDIFKKCAAPEHDLHRLSFRSLRPTTKDEPTAKFPCHSFPFNYSLPKV